MKIYVFMYIINIKQLYLHFKKKYLFKLDYWKKTHKTLIKK